MELGRGLLEDDSSVLFRHEIAYVLGQIQHPDSMEALVESLKRVGEHAMVRHESAEALGAIEGRWDEVEVVLKMFLEDEDVVVRESCLVALDAADYWGHAAASNDVGGVELPSSSVMEGGEVGGGENAQSQAQQQVKSFVQIKAQEVV